MTKGWGLKHEQELGEPESGWREVLENEGGRYSRQGSRHKCPVMGAAAVWTGEAMRWAHRAVINSTHQSAETDEVQGASQAREGAEGAVSPGRAGNERRGRHCRGHTIRTTTHAQKQNQASGSRAPCHIS